MARNTTEEGAAPMGFMEALRSGVGTLVSLLKTRVELIGTELEEQREWLEKLVILSVVTLFCLSFGVFFLTLFITLLFGAEYRQYVVGAFAGLYFLAGIGAFLTMKKKVKNKPRLFAATAAELGKDHQNLVEKMMRENA